MSRQTSNTSQKESVRNESYRHPLVYLFGLLGFFTFVGVGYFFQLINDPEKFPIEKIAVDGEFLNLKPQDVEDLVSDAVVGGFFSLDVAYLREKMLINPWVESVSVRRIWPDSIRVSITEQSPVAYWGEHALLNEHADIFAPSSLEARANLVKLDGPVGSEATVLAKLREFKPTFDELGIELLSLGMNERRSWTIGTVGGVLINLGRDDLLAKIKRFKTAYRNSLTNEWERVLKVDLRYTNGLTVQHRAALPAVSAAEKQS
ncbi:MAG: cell division protein FtsQ/DivIB [Gammaproteobacteria bacterium]